MSTYLEQSTLPDGPDTRQLEMKIHYLLGMMAKAGLLKDSDGKKFTTMTSEVQQDSDAVQSTIHPENF